MSFFNEANELASRLVWGRGYQDNAPRPLDEVTLVRNGMLWHIPSPEQADHRAWADTATLIEALLLDGWSIV